MKRKIDTIIIHCSATKAGQNYTATDIDGWHRKQGSEGIGYHYVVCLNGKIEKGRDIGRPGAHCRGWNARSIGICYIGGLDANGKPADTRTEAQKRALYRLVKALQRDYPSIRVVIGHRDTSPDLNGNGRIDPQEYIKACPCFDVKKWLEQGREKRLLLLAILIIPLLLWACRSGKKMQSSHLATVYVADSAYGRREKSRHSSAAVRMEQTEEHTEETIYLSNELSDQPLSRRVTTRKTCQTTQTEKAVERTSTDSIKRVKLAIEEEKTAMNQHNQKTPESKWRGWLVIVLIMLGGGYIWKRKRKRSR